MANLTCPKCGLVQPLRDDCLRCGLVFMKWGTHQAVPPTPPSAPAAPEAPPPPPSAARLQPAVLLAAAAGALVLAGLIYWALAAPRSGGSSSAAPAAPATPAAATETLAGVWTGLVHRAVAGPPPRETTKSVEIRSDAQGAILGASVVQEDPVSGAAGAGYRLDSGGASDLEALLARIDEKGEVSAFTPGFVRLPAGLAAPATWHVIEGYWDTPPRGKRSGKPRKPEEIRYVLLESDADDALFQIGETRGGFQSYVYFTKSFFSLKMRDTDQISAIIDPPPGSRLHSFSHLVWDLSGTTEFLKMRIEATVTGPGGGPDALFLTKKP